jgi:uridine kinase
MAGRVELSASTWRQPWPPPVDPGRSAVVATIADRVLALGSRRVSVAVDGRTAAGKTTLGHELARCLADAGRVVLRASLDDFKRPWAEAHRYDRVSGEGYYRNAFDLDAIRDLLLAPARPSGIGLVALCSIDPLTQVDHSATRVTMPADGILVVDGVFALRPELDPYWDLRIWVDVPPELSLRRGTGRDAPREGASQAEALHQARYGPAEAIYIAEVDPAARAEIVLDNTRFDDPGFVTGRGGSGR